MDAYSSNKGPASMQLFYSTDGVNYTQYSGNKNLSVGIFGEYYSKTQLPSVLANKDKAYIRLVMKEDKRAEVG